MKAILTTLLVFLSCSFITIPNYPIDGYETTGIKRLDYLNKLYKDELKGRKKLPPGALFPLSYVKLNLENSRGAQINGLPEVDSEFQNQIESIFRGLSSNYSITALDISDGKPTRYMQMRETKGYQPGSVGKLVVLAAFFTEIAKIHPTFSLRTNLMKTKHVKGGNWALYDHHTVPVYNMETQHMVHRRVTANDVFTLYEWVDNMVSPSNNGSASVVWRETLLMHVFGMDYPNLTYEEGEAFFKSRPKSELSELAITVINQPLRDLGITHDEWRLGSFFTSGASHYIPRKGGSIGTPIGLMKYMIALEKGQIVDPQTSLEMKRLIYMTGRRIRYAAAPELKEAAVYFKSGSLYKCQKEEGFGCGKYMGNVYNYMNSVAIVEHPENGTKYIVCLMSNVKRKNSAWDHLSIASKIDKIIQNN